MEPRHKFKTVSLIDTNSDSKSISDISDENILVAYKKVNNSYVFFKRILDIIISLVIVFFAIPIILITAILIFIESPGNPFYKQKRVGLMGQSFYIFKLRSMYINAEENTGAVWASRKDPRITNIGKIIRKVRIDELPQLFNVLIGNMSLIGPRPERPNFTRKFMSEYPGFEHRLVVKPGLSGYAQINGGYDISPQEKLIKDLYYINHFSFKMDLIILIHTVRVILTGEGAR